LRADVQIVARTEGICCGDGHSIHPFRAMIELL
jgi:hypothetical protein